MPRGISWRASEIDFLIENAETMSVTDMALHLEGRSEKAIKRMIEKLRQRGEIGYKYKGAAKTPKKKKSDDDVWGSSPWEESPWD